MYLRRSLVCLFVCLFVLLCVQSYAGKYIPALGYTIFSANRDPERSLTINLKGVLIGDGLVDPVNVSVWGAATRG